MWKIKQLVQHEHLKTGDEEFVILVYKDIDGFLNENSDRCVLIFPPLNNRRRYLVHKVGEVLNLPTFSVGKGVWRLIVVCASEIFIKQVDEEIKVMDKFDCNKGAISKAKRATRPDAPIYIPPAIRRVQKTLLPEKDDKSHQSFKSNRQEDNKMQANIVTETCIMHTETHEKSETVVNIKQNSSDLNINQLVNYKCGETAPVLNVYTSKNKSNVPERIVINLTSDENETSTIIKNVKKQPDVSNAVPSNSQNIIKSQENNSEIIIKSKENYAKNISNKQETNNPKVVEINIESEITNYSDDINEENKAVNSGIDKKELWETNNKANKDNDRDQEEFHRASEEINRRNKKIMKQSFNNSNILIIDEKTNGDPARGKAKLINKNENISQEKETPVDCWEDLLDGEKLGSDLMLEIIDHVGHVNIRKAKEDYSSFKQKTSLEGDYAHVLEIYNFPKEFQTRDLVTILDSIKTGTSAYHIKWVDENHALGVFVSGFVATEMLKITHPLIKLRPMSEASKQAISKAIQNPSAMLPIAVRPQTCPQAARRMVTGALGLKLTNAKEERAKELKILKEAREKKRLAARQQDDAWEGKPSSN